MPAISVWDYQKIEKHEMNAKKDKLRTLNISDHEIEISPDQKLYVAYSSDAESAKAALRDIPAQIKAEGSGYLLFTAHEDPHIGTILEQRRSVDISANISIVVQKLIALLLAAIILAWLGSLLNYKLDLAFVLVPALLFLFYMYRDYREAVLKCLIK